MTGTTALALLIFIVSVNASNETYSFNCLLDPIGICGDHGICINNGTFGFKCKCDKNWDNQGCDTTQCCNELYPRNKLFIISLLFGWTGAPYFILDDIALGVILLLFFNFSWISIIVSTYEELKEGKDNTTAAVVLLMLVSIWPFTIMIMILTSSDSLGKTKIGPW